jgi:cytochrome oxidase Cu insertion factor (SCO1/SenC/PrrC family)
MIVLAVGASGALLYFTFPSEAKPQVLKPIGPDGAFAPPNQGDTPQQQQRSGAGPQIGQVAPDIEGEDLDGTKFKLSDYRGKVVVVDFWGDW